MLQGALFTEDFLREGIAGTQQWAAISDDVFFQFRDRVAEIFADFPVGEHPNEANTERRLIDPVLEALGWEGCFLVQEATGRNRQDIPDYLLFSEVANRQAAEAEDRAARYRHGISIVEAKRWQRPLDRGVRGEPDILDDGVPSTQMLRYLSRSEVASNRAIQWGILTNGRHWRLYFQGARSRSEEFFELDLPVVATVSGIEQDLFSASAEECEHFLKVFFAIFQRGAFLPGDDGQTFHEAGLDISRRWEATVADDLSVGIFQNVFPNLARGLAAHDSLVPSPLTADYLEEVRVGALTLLYRLLFVLYAEDRRLLPVDDSRYDDYALEKIRERIRDQVDTNDAFSTVASSYHDRLRGLFRALHSGDPALGLPPYNGGLFDPDAHHLLERVSLPDSLFAPILDDLSRREEGGTRKYINYRDLSVQQLGSIYERLLERSLAVDEAGNIIVQLNPFARKTSGSYYTHQDLVDLIIERTVGPLLEERRTAFAELDERLRSSRRPKATRLRQLAKADPAQAFLELRVCDPAMGSGHFLVSLVDYLADNVLEAIADAETLVGWADADAPYVSPLTSRIAAIREQISEHAEQERWAIRSDHLNDRQIIRRIILKRVVHGVDKYPMAVELAKVSLWLHTFTVGAPLSFLDHHLRCGDSLYGEWIGPALQELSDHYSLLINPVVQQARNAVSGMDQIETLTDADIVEVHASASAFDGIMTDTEPLRRFLDFRHALRWLGYHNLGSRNVPEELVAVLDGSLGDPFDVIAGGADALEVGAERREEATLFQNEAQYEAPSRLSRREQDTRERAANLLRAAQDIARRERFLHWQVAFPNVWREWESANRHGGFDAVVGNPPWDRIKLQQVEWFAARRPEISQAPRAADRKRMIGDLEANADPLWTDYMLAQTRSEASANVARRCGDYPLLSRGDVNIYSLFVERSTELIRRRGMFGLLTPSGISSDKSAADFFKSIATSGRLSGLFDFENRRPGTAHFFPDVDSRFKFSALIACGGERTVEAADCAFFLHDVTEIDDSDRAFNLTPEDFMAVNPNTGTAPVFRTRRDSKITTEIYSRFPILVDHRSDPPATMWPVQYVRMFDMTNDSDKFLSATTLESEGWYRIEGNRWRRGEEETEPLYVGRMIHQFDHRSASVAVNEENLHNPALSDQITLQQHRDPNFYTIPQYWVKATDVVWSTECRWAVAFRDIARVTDARTAIASMIPFSGVGNTLPLILPQSHGALEVYKHYAPLMLANFNSFGFDFIARQKVQGTHLNWYIVEQLPFIPEDDYNRIIGPTPAGELIRSEVLRLTYSANDMASFAQDMGYDGPPFVWDEQERRHARARIDALYFLLYGIEVDEADYVLDTFPIVQRDDEREFGRFLTRELVLGYMRAFAAGDTETRIAV